MKTLLLSILFVFLNSFSYGQDSKCLKTLKTGKFTYEGMEDQVLIIRTKKTQTEIYNNGESRIIMEIRWTDERNYELIMKEFINVPKVMDVGDIIYTRILTCEGKSYKCSFTAPGVSSGESVFIKLD